ncbi:MAG TPA: hypothetical protein VHM30_05680 [Gemmatimonadaceae bacterium]|nr:hypothetical protein [Gemmatimonadaceae bacterium]
MRIARRLAPAALVLAAACADTKHPAAPTAGLALDQSTSPGVHVYQFRTEEDPAVSGAREFCATAPFQANVFLNASAWATQTRASDGQVVNDGVRQVGTVVACAQLTNFAFPPGLLQNFAARFDFNDGSSYTATGTCTLISNNVPEPKLILAGCALKVLPNDLTAGGMATSASVFNPFRLAGYQTGSYWTLQLYDAL